MGKKHIVIQDLNGVGYLKTPDNELQLGPEGTIWLPLGVGGEFDHEGVAVVIDSDSYNGKFSLDYFLFDPMRGGLDGKFPLEELGFRLSPLREGLLRMMSMHSLVHKQIYQLQEVVDQIATMGTIRLAGWKESERVGTEVWRRWSIMHAIAYMKHYLELVKSSQRKPACVVLAEQYACYLKLSKSTGYWAFDTKQLDLIRFPDRFSFPHAVYFPAVVPKNRIIWARAERAGFGLTTNWNDKLEYQLNQLGSFVKEQFSPTELSRFLREHRRLLKSLCDGFAELVRDQGRRELETVWRLFQAIYDTVYGAEDKPFTVFRFV